MKKSLIFTLIVILFLSIAGVGYFGFKKYQNFQEEKTKTIIENQRGPRNRGYSQSCF